MTDLEVEYWLTKWQKSGQSMSDFLALANANGLKLPQVLEVHKAMIEGGYRT